MATVFLRVSRPNSLVPYAVKHPVHVELRQSRETRAREWNAVVSANRVGKPVLAKDVLEDFSGLIVADSAHSFAREQESAVLIGDRERIAVGVVP
jgi:hypothetical protein